jgi:hypothetical protein
MLTELLLVVLVPLLIIAFALLLEYIERGLDRPAAVPSNTHGSVTTIRDGSAHAAADAASGFAADP